MAWQNPKTDWAVNPKNPVPEDFNRIEGNIDFLKQDIETKKGLIVDAINDMNQSAQVTDTHAQLASKIRDISKDATAAVGDVEKGKTFYAGGQKRTGTLELTGDAGPGDVLTGKTFYNTDLKTKRTGTMPNRGAVVITPGTSNKAIQAGYHNGQGYVKGDPNLVAGNIAKGKSIFGVNGSFLNNIVVGVQQGRGEVSSSPNRLVVNHSTVDTSRVLYIVEPEYFNNEYASQCYIDVDSITPTSFEIVFGGVRYPKKVVWKIIEFDAQIVKSLQRGNVESNNSDPYYIDVSINPVNRNKVIYISQYATATYYGTSSDGNIYGAASMLTSDTNLRFYGYATSAKAFWQVLEFY